MESDVDASSASDVDVLSLSSWSTESVSSSSFFAFDVASSLFLAVKVLSSPLSALVDEAFSWLLSSTVEASSESFSEGVASDLA